MSLLRQHGRWVNKSVASPANSSLDTQRSGRPTTVWETQSIILYLSLHRAQPGMTARSCAAPPLSFTVARFLIRTSESETWQFPECVATELCWFVLIMLVRSGNVGSFWQCWSSWSSKRAELQFLFHLGPRCTFLLWERSGLVYTGRQHCPGGIEKAMRTRHWDSREELEDRGTRDRWWAPPSYWPCWPPRHTQGHIILVRGLSNSPWYATRPLLYPSVLDIPGEDPIVC